MKLGVVSLGLLCEPIGGQARPSDEALSVAWLEPEEAIRAAPEDQEIRIADALSGSGPSIRVHDGTHLLASATESDLD
ncbi:hypothetical protein NE857_33020 [Nocardiopsis exhalans]|uniref:Uncharacterized protein n=1 Tax=Nocardiopsis exhalans TaxID=163604 RepID=A0ABY5DA20_9ACTN|nr:hypothetical protein [Nocardiopsis exhalans]USY19992.1 hypothetical protein NE857_33020 [Nocardiopsis exhalans]